MQKIDISAGQGNARNNMTVQEIKDLLEETIEEKQRLGDYFNDQNSSSAELYYAEANALLSILQQINDKEEEENDL